MAASTFEQASNQASNLRDQATRTFNQASQGVGPHEHGEGTITKAIESYTSMVPSGVFLSLGVGAIGLAAGLKCAGRDKDAEFVGHWVPTILILGLYNKLVKTHGSE